VRSMLAITSTPTNSAKRDFIGYSPSQSGVNKLRIGVDCLMCSL